MFSVSFVRVMLVLPLLACISKSVLGHLVTENSDYVYVNNNGVRNYDVREYVNSDGYVYERHSNPYETTVNKYFLGPADVTNLHKQQNHLQNKTRKVLQNVQTKVLNKQTNIVEKFKKLYPELKNALDVPWTGFDKLLKFVNHLLSEDNVEHLLNETHKKRRKHKNHNYKSSSDKEMLNKIKNKDHFLPVRVDKFTNEKEDVIPKPL